MKSGYKNQIFFLGSSCFGAYAACYCGRTILSAIMPQIIEAGVFSKNALAAMGSCYFFSYGIGQLINGFVGDRIKARFMVFIGLLLSGIDVIAFGFNSVFLGGMILWGICGFLLSMLWGPITKIVAENTNDTSGQIILTLLNVASILGSMIAYGVASAVSHLESWRPAFTVAGIILIITAVVWYVFIGRLEACGHLKMETAKKGYGLSRSVINAMLDNAFVPMIFVMMINGILRNAVDFWIPTYISEVLGASPGLSSSLTSILPIVNVVGTFAGVYFYRVSKNNEFSTYIVSFLCTAAAFLAMWFINGRIMILSLIFLFCASALMSSVCNIIFSAYVIRFKYTDSISGITGFINFICYIAASLAGILFGGLIEKAGWNSTVFIWMAISAAGAVSGAACIASEKKSLNKLKKAL